METLKNYSVLILLGFVGVLALIIWRLSRRLRNSQLESATLKVEKELDDVDRKADESVKYYQDLLREYDDAKHQLLKHSFDK